LRPRVWGLCGIFFGFDLGVVLAVDGHELLGDHAGAQPEPEPEEMRGDGSQFKGTVRLGTVQENGHAQDGDVSSHQRVQRNLPPGEVQQAVSQPVNCRVKHGPIGKQHKKAFFLVTTSDFKVRAAIARC
jgi:hypothetical protein